MKKNLLFLLMFVFNTHLFAPQAGSTGFDANLALINFATTVSSAQLPLSTSTLVNACTCPVPPQVIPIALPQLYITFQNSTGTIVNTFTFPTNSNFRSRLAILTIQIFPPSNQVIDTGIVTLSTQNSYAIVYSLESPDGLYVQNAIQYVESNSAQGIMAIRNGVPTIPTTVSIYKNNNSVSTNLLTTWTFLPSLSGLNLTVQQQLLNSVCPITQKFLLTTNNVGLNQAITPITSSYDPNSNLTAPAIITSLIPTTVSSTIPVASSPTTEVTTNTTTVLINPITLTVYNGTTSTYLFSFQQTTLQFTNVDLINGLLMQLFIYPPLYQNGATSTTFMMIATLQTLDGLKFQKIVNTAAIFTNYPVTYNINTTSLNQGNMTNYTSTFANPSLTAQTYNMISPINLRTRLQQIDDQTISVTIA